MGRTRQLTDFERRQRADEFKERYYGPTRWSKRGWLPWTEDEIQLILDKSYTDLELANMLERSIMAIQVKRCMILKREKYNDGEYKTTL